MAETRYKDGKYWVRRGDEAHQITKGQYDQINWQTAMESARPEGTGERMLVGAGKRFTDVGYGLADLLARVQGDEAGAAALGQARRGDLERYEAGAGVPERVGEVGADLATYGVGALGAARIGGIGLPGQVAAQSGAAGLTGLAITPGDIEQRGRQALQDALFTAGGTTVGVGLERVINRLRNHRLGLTQQQRKAGEALESGMQLSPGAVGGGWWQRTVEPWVETAGGFVNARDANEELFQRTVGRALGQADDNIDLSATGLGQAEKEIGDLFDVLQGTRVEMTPEQARQLQGVANLSEYMKFPADRNYITGHEYKRIRRQLTDQARKDQLNPAAPVDRDKIILQLRKRLDLQFRQQLGKDAAQQFKVARERWKILETIERGAAVSPDGVIRPNSMRNAVNQLWGKTLRREKFGGVEPETRAWLEQVNQQASQFTRSAVGSSGTAERLGMGVGNMLTTTLGGGGAAAGAYALMEDDPTPLGLLSSGITGMVGANRFLANYGRMGALTSRAGQLGQAGGPAAAALVRGLLDDEVEDDID